MLHIISNRKLHTVSFQMVYNVAVWTVGPVNSTKIGFGLSTNSEMASVEIKSSPTYVKQEYGIANKISSLGDPTQRLPKLSLKKSTLLGLMSCIVKHAMKITCCSLFFIKFCAH